MTEQSTTRADDSRLATATASNGKQPSDAGMFDVLSGEFILTLQSSPPFVVESAFALALAVLLAAPLIASVHFLLVRIVTVMS